MSRIPCERCGASLAARFGTDWNGRAVLVEVAICRRCLRPKAKRAWAVSVNDERRRACVCQLCDAPVVGKPKVALYCEAHRLEQRKASFERHRAKVGWKHQQDWKERNREKTRRSARNYYRKSKARRQARNDYKREWRKRNRDKVKLQKRRYALRGHMARKMAERRAAGKTSTPIARRNERGERLCLTPECAVVVHGRAKLCDACRNAGTCKQPLQLQRAA